MARALRVEYAGAHYHVINRGNYRRNLFVDEGAGEAFDRTLNEAAQRFDWRIHAYVVMRNHFHLALEVSEPNLSLGMKWLQGTWVQRYNRYRRIVGRPFQGRFKAILVEPGHVFEQVCHYIHLNPVRAGAVPLEKIFEHRLSSLRAFRKPGRPAWLESGTVLRAAGDLPDSGAGWEGYIRYLVIISTDLKVQREWGVQKLSRGWCLGGKEFKKAAREDLASAAQSFERNRFEGVEPDAIQHERECAWEERLVRLAKTAGIDLGQLQKKKSQPGKVLLAAALKRSSAASNRWIAERLSMGQPRSVSVIIARWNRPPKNEQRVRALLLNVATFPFRSLNPTFSVFSCDAGAPTGKRCQRRVIKN